MAVRRAVPGSRASCCRPPARLQLLAKEHARLPRHIERDPPKLLVAVALIKSRRLKAARLDHDLTAAAPLGFCLQLSEHPAAEVSAAQPLGQKEHVEEQQTEFGPAPQPADDLAARRIGGCYGNRSPIGDAGLGDIVFVESRPGRSLGSGIGRVSQGQYEVHALEFTTKPRQQRRGPEHQMVSCGSTSAPGRTLPKIGKKPQQITVGVSDDKLPLPVLDLVCAIPALFQ